MARFVADVNCARPRDVDVAEVSHSVDWLDLVMSARTSDEAGATGRLVVAIRLMNGAISYRIEESSGQCRGS